MPLGEYMRAVIKNNKSIQLDKTKRFKRRRSMFKDDLDFSKYPEATPEVLDEIRLKLKKERQHKYLKRVVVFAIVFLISAYILYSNLNWF